MSRRILPADAARRGPYAIFVYGTLMRGRRNAHWWPCRAQRIAPASVVGSLVDCGDYPGLVAGEHQVSGECWWYAPSELEQVLERLDILEDHRGRPGDLYQRAVMTVRLTAGTHVKAWGYQWRGPDMPLITPDERGRVAW